ncbi:MAG: carboxypeptidase-like regulatory domain-containing protein [Acidobacteriota bacterium]
MRPESLAIAGVAIAAGCLAAETASPTLDRVKVVAVTGGEEGCSARPEIAATASRVFVLYLGHVTTGTARTFDLKIFDAGLDAVLVTKTLVSTSAEYGGPTDIRIASEGQSLYAFYETNKPRSPSTGVTYLWGAKYTMDDDFPRVAYTSTPIATSRPLAELEDGDELLDDPAPLIGPSSVFVITRLKYSLSTSGRTAYRVREFSKNDLSGIRTYDVDLSDAADGRARVASLLFDGESIFIALATTVSNQGTMEETDDGAPSDIVLVRMRPDWTYDPHHDVMTISAEPDDRENYVAGLETDGQHFYITYKQAVGIPPSGEQRAWIKVLDLNFNPVLSEVVRSTVWGPGGGELRPSLEVFQNRIFSGQSTGEALGSGDAAVWVYELQDNGRIYGTVTEKRGRHVARARVKLSGGGSSWKTRSSSTGQYSLEDIPSGSYTLGARKRGVGQARNRVVVTTGSTRVDLKLR